jgi:superfamily II DNA or RNA helicase/diadenosine tetraphosphate (Ap4A) HIT family hydrolase/HKD family nuclease
VVARADVCGPQGSSRNKRLRTWLSAGGSTPAYATNNTNKRSWNSALRVFHDGVRFADGDGVSREWPGGPFAASLLTDPRRDEYRAAVMNHASAGRSLGARDGSTPHPGPTCGTLRTPMPCPFCHPPTPVWSSLHVLAIRDAFPVSPGHTLILPRRHIATWFDATPAEHQEIFRAITELKRQLDNELSPDGYNIGINAGEAAGQTVMHLHVHLVPRFHGDVDDPAGGVRFVIPAYGDYRQPGTLPRPSGPPPAWLPPAKPTSRLAVGGEHDPFVRHLRPWLARARQVDIVAAFVQGSGVDLLATDIIDALRRGTRFRVIAGDYLHITQSQALRTLLDWAHLATTSDDPDPGTFDVRVVETAAIDGRSFHPKSWRVETAEGGVAWVGSSNWSWMALAKGIEWNLRVERATDPAAYADLGAAFTTLWAFATPLTADWLAGYADRSARHDRPLPWGDADDIAPATYAPLGVQPQALAALERSRAAGRRRALIVLATGLGKTFLAAFDVRAVAESLGRPPRVLFIAHRRELLTQAASTFRKVFPDATLGFFVGQASDLTAQLVFASVQKLALQADLATLVPDRFDYVVVDESHHAPADSYRRVLDQLDPGFLLGLTATPERADQADVAALFDDHVPFRADLGEGIDIGRLVPFDYAGLPDTIAFEPIPWRSYTVEQLSALAETEARMQRLLAAWKRYPGTRTLIFCVSIRHADYVSAWLRTHDLRVVAVHTGENSGDRATALDDLDRGALDAVAAVDLFNEGIDLPRIDRVVMLRPTGSPVVFLQQLGRGLRVAEGKTRLQIIDFIGNHRIFLQKIRMLLSLSSTHRSLGQFLRGPTGEVTLRSGCQVDVDLAVIDMLRKFLPSGSKNQTIRLYRELRDAREQRPAAGELARMGMNPRSITTGWLAFVDDEGDLTPDEQAAYRHAPDWFAHLEVSPTTKSYMLVTLEVLLDADALFTGLPLDALAARSHPFLARDPFLRVDVGGVDAFAAGPDSPAWRAHWRKNPVRDWTRGKWFDLTDDRLQLTKPPPPGAVRDAFLALTRELLDLRLALYRRRAQARTDGASSFVCAVIHNKRHPILKLPDAQRSRLPTGETDVRMDDGRIWQFRFQKIACNVARPVGTTANSLPDLLYGWFGPAAGKPGTAFQVRFRRSPEGWWAEPLGVVIELPPRGEVVCFPTLRAAAGAGGAPQSEMDASTVRLPFGGDGRFAVRAAGDSMDGGMRPIRDGDWAVLEWARGLGAAAVVGAVCLLARGDVHTGQTHHLKRVVRRGRALHLRSDNPASPELPVTDGTAVIARLVDVVRPEALAPTQGTVLSDIGAAFGLSEPPPAGTSRIDGHLFLCVDGPGALTAPDRLAWRVRDRGEAETAYVLTALGAGWRYAGVGRWDGTAWTFPAVDFATWRALGEGRSASRALDPLWASAAEAMVAHLDAAHAPGDWLEGRGRRCRFHGRSARGGVRIDHDTMKQRTVSALDLAWVIQAYDRRNEHGDRVDEAWVNALRYLDGTPKASTRWIDTGWALVLLDHAIQHGFVASVAGPPFGTSPGP